MITLGAGEKGEDEAEGRGEKEGAARTLAAASLINSERAQTMGRCTRKYIISPRFPSSPPSLSSFTMLSQASSCSSIGGPWPCPLTSSLYKSCRKSRSRADGKKEEMSIVSFPSSSFSIVSSCSTSIVSFCPSLPRDSDSHEESSACPPFPSGPRKARDEDIGTIFSFPSGMEGSGRGEGKGKRADVAACKVWLWPSPNISMLMISRGKEASLW